ncbi:MULTISPECIES: hypothetical protein [Sphingobium]|jgi:hypothetical protein|uniref:Uncharacterized protein n=1 Tax=Sphingobium fuliginis (strain ATCC 27551) TaxID=336203 RepID=A0A292ZGV6_SPHSA|nr:MULTISPECIES: hypothetical protein [Sphingobium]QOT70415.1 hypothetical protein H5V43_09575 [Sphingobium fuliginis]RYM00853.1 hypothetical protein EWH10_01950 [Sphingobium fuliginis]UXC89451.1 hypothetical protein EGM87_10205 [Sphingobium sp. RSMS]WDA38338.1 hypothetical protein PO876_09255 [Sphingobium sp. YC-XJ3]GAY22079.1 hypothetical protein SFOMI_2634 [Sphingobium fuliginis]
MESSLWAMVTIGGPILLGIVLIFVMLSNRRHRTPEEMRRTEDATRDLYRRLDQEDKAREFGSAAPGNARQAEKQP